MTSDDFWDLFKETGDPSAYLLYRSTMKSGGNGGMENVGKTHTDDLTSDHDVRL